ncbi:MAG: YdcH family protein [Defluviicoccus sp.]|nr:YdcH family protein [Defluviicoccus sp.]
MNVEEQAASLKARHAELEEALSQENARPMPDAATIADLKKRKLRIKDELAKLAVPTG